jgi:hypothetical protein
MSETEFIEDPHEDLLRDDKIFNNSYYNGDKLKNPDEYEFSKKISVSPEYSDNYLKDLYEYEEQLDSKFILDFIFDFIQNDELLNTYVINLTKNESRIKFSKDEINLFFNRIHQHLNLSTLGNSFYSPIYIVEAISSISSIEYKKIFDLFDTEIQEILLLELDKKYNFLDGKKHKKGIH